MIDLDDLKAICDGLPYPIFAKSSENVFIYGNKYFNDLVGGDSYIGKTDYDLCSPADADLYLAEDMRVFAGQPYVRQTRLSEDRIKLTTKYPVTFKDGSVGLVGVVINGPDRASGSETALTENDNQSEHTFEKGKVAVLERLLLDTVREKREALDKAMTDVGTGLRNRSGLEYDLNRAIEDCRTTGKRFGLAFKDLDYFKRINDRLGHEAGDLLLQELARRYRKIDDLISVARLGGDEFAFAFELPENEVDVNDSGACEVKQVLQEPIEIAGRTVHMTASIGVAVFPIHGDDLTTLKRNADAALLKSKADGRNRMTIFSEELRKAAERRRIIEDELPKAIASGEIEPHFQPIVCSDTKDVLSVEALARWTLPQLGEIPPDEFIEIAQDCGLLSHLDRALFTQAAIAARKYVLSGDIQQLSFNVSPLEITEKGFATKLLNQIENVGLEPRHICIEIVETAAVHDLDVANENLNRLHDEGVCIALDDFGTGFSNLRSLLDLPLDRIKIARSLIRDMEANPAVFDLFLTIVSLAGILEVSMVAEGLETDFNALMVASAGVTHLQGFYFAKPMNVKDLSVWLKERKCDRPLDTPKADDVALAG